MKTQIILGYAIVIDMYRRIAMLSNSTIKLIYLPGINKLRCFNSKVRAFAEFVNAKKNVPAYQKFLTENGFTSPGFKGFIPNIEEIPSIDKESYIRKFELFDRCIDGVLPSHGVIIDESSGSTGTATNWVRGIHERSVNAKMIEFGLRNLFGTEPLFIINGFALGAWATGVNVTMACSKFATVKSIGPDKSKIIKTLLEFGPNQKYIIMGYPPFLKQLVDETEIDWHDYNISFIFGGESMTEGMRDYMFERGIKKAYSSLGASDLELNISAENDFTISVRKLMQNNSAFREKMSKHPGALPMIFQYNPSDFLMEISEEGEILVTICRPGYVAPKIRYNIHDRGHISTVKEIFGILKELNIDCKSIGKPQTDLPLLFHYGRSDMTVSFYGCNISPVDIQEAIYQTPMLAQNVNSFRIDSNEDEFGAKSLNIAFETVSGTEYLQQQNSIIVIDFFDELAAINQDFRESRRIAGNAELYKISFHNSEDILYKDNDYRIKLNYIHKKSSIAS